MNAYAGRDHIRRPVGRHASLACRALLTAALLVLLLFSCLFAAAQAGAAAAPGKPTAKKPSGVGAITKPTFTWSKAKGAAKYELRVFQGKKQALKKTGITRLSWKSSKALPKNVALTWKVRASGAGGVGYWSKSRGFRVVTGSPAKAITAFSFQGLAPPVIGVINEADHTVALAVPFGTDVSALVPTIAFAGASVSPASGVAGDFTSPATYTVTAADASVHAYLVTVTVTPLAIGDDYQGGKVAYILQSGDPGYVAGQTHGLIAAPADQSTAMRWDNGALIVTGATATALGTGSANTNAIIAAQGVTATDYAAGLARAYAGGGYHDWYLPSKDELGKLYANRAAIGAFDLTPGGDAQYGTGPYWSSTEADANFAWCQYFSTGTQHLDWKFGPDYRVRAVRAFPADPANKAITAFSFASSGVTGVVNETLHTVSVTVPFSTDVGALVASFTTTGASVAVGGTPQVSGATANDFSSPITYTVTAADSSTQTYAVSVTVAAAVIGQSHGGGKVAYVDASGQHGLIAAVADQAAGTGWTNAPLTLIGATAGGTAIGTGQANTTAIVGQAGCTAGAAYICDRLVEGGFSDWYLPSKDELNQLFINRTAIGGFSLTWSYLVVDGVGRDGRLDADLRHGHPDVAEQVQRPPHARRPHVLTVEPASRVGSRPSTRDLTPRRCPARAS